MTWEHDYDETDDYILFLKGFLSQWYASRFTIDGVEYNRAEQWMMAEKARLFHDEVTLEKILKSDSPSEQKKLGRKVKGFDPVLWDSVCNQVVFQGSFEKFYQNPDLLDRLLNTGEKRLVEVNPKDRIWGVGYSAENALDNVADWGENRLGVILTDVRETLKMEKSVVMREFIFNIEKEYYVT